MSSSPELDTSPEAAARRARATAFELILRQAQKGKPWVVASADIMREHGITRAEVEAELESRAAGLSAAPDEPDEETKKREQAAMYVDIVKQMPRGSQKEVMAEFRKRVLQSQSTEIMTPVAVEPQEEARQSEIVRFWQKLFTKKDKRKQI